MIDKDLFKLWVEQEGVVCSISADHTGEYTIPLSTSPVSIGVDLQYVAVKDDDAHFLVVGTGPDGEQYGFYDNVSSATVDAPELYNDEDEDLPGDRPILAIKGGRLHTSPITEQADPGTYLCVKKGGRLSVSPSTEKAVPICTLFSSKPGYDVVIYRHEERYQVSGDQRFVHLHMVIEHPGDDECVMPLKFRVGDTYAPIDVSSPYYDHLYE